MKMYEYLIGSLVFVGIWIILCLIRKDLYKEMLFCSFLCAPLGLTDAIFIPWYWNPGIILKINLFNLTFSMEGLIFSFAIGGIAAVLYQVFFKKHLKRNKEKKRKVRNRFCILIVVFNLLFILDISIVYTKIIFIGYFMYVV